MLKVLQRICSLNIFFLLAIVLFSFNGYAQLSKKHFIPPLTNSSFGNANPEDQYIYISTPSNSNVPYTIIPVGQPSTSYITGTVSNAAPDEISIGTGYGQLFMLSTQTSLVTNNKGYIIEADAPIYVSVRLNAGNGAQAGALVSKGLSALGTTFRVGSYTNQNPQDNYLNFVSVMATEDNTVVNFSNLPTGLIIKNYTGATPINVTLNEGESYTIATNSDDSTINRDGLTGCLVNSDKPIVVNCGSTNGSFGTGNGRDYGIDQIVDLSKVGTEYIFVRGDGDNAWENVLIVAHTNNTTISINGNSATATINSGEYYVIEGNQYSSAGNMYVETNAPVFAYQGVGGLGNNGSPNEANQGMFFVPPLSCETRGNLNNIANINDIGNTNYSGGISIVTKVGATVTINNNPISVSASPVTGKSDYITYKVKGLNGNISVESNDELYCAYFNYNGSATSGSFYSGFPSAPEINFDAQFSTLGNCIPNITLKAANTQSFDSFKWLFDDGTSAGYVDLTITTPEITPTQPGKYKLVGIISCTGEELESIEIPISICPDDYDNDGIIDNLDIDNDNDGILNCEESKGDAIINLSDLSIPEIIFQDGSRNNTISSGNYTASNNSGNANTFSGNSSGGFTSILGNATSAENNYEMTFSEPVNIKFEETISLPSTNIEDEYFIAKILPINKNITLIDPDDHLLVDTNFDGIFEAGVTQVSGSEIHFRINPSPNGTTAYQFLANQIDGFSFIHILENGAASSIFNGGLSLTCFKNDNDYDGVPDSLDLDSDNDGIPDVIEGQGTVITLSDIDLDNNGLDDIFDVASTPLDTDNDSIYDFYDLDSDNDGITDLVETGQSALFTDSDQNGIINGGNFGINGWFNNAETTPDSNEIGFTLSETDGDGIFNYLDSDSDNDGCNDVIEAGFSDGNSDNYLGDSNVVVDTSPDAATGTGLVTNASNGYTSPNAGYLNTAPLSITSQSTDLEVCESTNTNIFLSSPEAETFQWEVSVDNGATWNLVNDDAVYSNSNTSSLTLSSTPLSYNGYKYRGFINRIGNSCGLYSAEITLEVAPKPTVSNTVTLIQCDDEDVSTLGFSAFNLTEANNEISTNVTNETFTYYLTETAAEIGDETNANFISNYTTFENNTINSDAVYARVVGQNGCASVSKIELKVSTTSVPSSYLATFNQCDDFLDNNGNNTANNNNRDGIATFDFSSVNATIMSFIPAGQNPLPPRYYRNEVDALAEANEITDISNYRNIGYPNSQYIYVRVDSSISNDCLGLGPHVLLTVEPLPVANSVSIAPQCDDDFDGQFPFDTSQIESQLLGSQNPANFTISYVDETGASLPSPLPNPFLTSSQTITIRIENSTTSAPNGPCYDETALTFTVNEQPVANPVSDQAACDGFSGDIDNDGFYPFDTSAFTSTILGSQTSMEVYYDFIDVNGNLITNASSLPNPLNSQNQTITARVVNPNNTECYNETTINLTVNPLPQFTVETPRIVCSSDPTFSIELEPFEQNPTENFSYEWLWSSLDGTTTNELISNNRTITVSTPGTYTITLSKTDGSGCSKSENIYVNASETATITQDDVTIEDFSENNSVTINTTNLGSGTYQFALQRDGSNSIIYQDDPVFYNVPAGFYTLHVRDKICGVSSLNISVIGYPKYFTPNGDGINDFWHIKGIDASVQANSTVYIYDRYGKLIKQLKTQQTGWDGTAKGKRLPTDDYWFRVILEDGRIFSGHFTLKR